MPHETQENDHCFICEAALPFNPRYPVRLCEDCIGKAVNVKGEKLTFYNEGISGGFQSYNQATKTYGKEHACLVGGYPCYANEAYMGGIVLVPTEDAISKKSAGKSRNNMVKGWLIVVLPVLAAALLYYAYTISRNGYMDIGFTLFDGLLLGAGICMLVWSFFLAVKSVFVALLVCLLYLAALFYIDYYYDYKNDVFFNMAAITVLILAAILLTILVLNIPPVNQRMKSLQANGPRGPELWVIFVILPVFSLVGGHIYLQIASSHRVKQFLNALPTDTAVATVTDVRNYKTSAASRTTRYINNRQHSDALLEYSVDGVKIYRVLDNRKTQYQQGDKLEVKYVKEQPDMFEIVAPVPAQ
ncbi:hypothetical protein GA0116948_11820 [Chitinophaga costaii]|uniref:Uncharacterized protein n=1 Tax=Chitinophaga costaii TaxID=1335309 RepID=A0A1C4FXT0_9BACT|nr:hypothetical protein [Chitinophaga costaii]PUZ20899.1 hypothetical protein DCM91_17345 [Chitinophaga costaii]SCC60674.1 hypothetical protein GA0116948_11820 [Chitinophaga costaii]